MARRIVFVAAGYRPGTGSYVAGYDRYARNAAKALAALGGEFDSRIVAFQDGPAVSDRDDGCEFALLPGKGSIDGAVLPTGKALWEALRIADLVHILQPARPSGAIALTIARSLGKPIVVTDFGGAGLWLMRFDGGLALADRILFPCRALAEPLQGGLGERVHVLPAPVDDGMFAAAAAPRPGIKSRIVCGDPIIPESRLDRLVAAVPRGLELVLCGPEFDHQHAMALHRLARNAKGSVAFVPAAKELATTYRSAAAAVTGMGEGRLAPIALWPLEAMISGAALLVGQSHPAADFLDGPETGMSFLGDDELTSCLAKIAAGEWPDRTARADRAAASAARFGLRAIGAKLAAIYRSLLGPGNA